MANDEDSIEFDQEQERGRDRRKAKLQHEAMCNKIARSDLESIVARVSQKLEQSEYQPPNAIASIWGDLRLMQSMLKDGVSGRYNIPWKTASSVAAALLYFVTPVDAILDFIPFAGFLDDAVVITFAYELAKDDLKAYAKWKQGQVNSLPAVSELKDQSV